MILSNSFKILIVVLFVLFAANIALAQSQLYTGDTRTVPPKNFFLQAYADTTYGNGPNTTTTSIRSGITKNLEIKLGRTTIFEEDEPNTKIGPSIGLKWRMVGNGYNDSAAITLQRSQIHPGLTSERGDTSALLAISFPAKPGFVLFNYGLVWTGDSAANIEYISAAFAKRVSPQWLVALMYLDTTLIGNVPINPDRNQVAIGAIYYGPSRWSISFQTGYLPNFPTHWHSTIGFGKYF